MKHYRITIRVVYDEATIPADMKHELERNLDRAVSDGLLSDSNGEAEIEEYSVDVEDGRIAEAKNECDRLGIPLHI
jgi:hypothetical protein